MKSKIKVLNLYAGIGGNRKLWENVDVVAVEINEDIARIYKDFFPDDLMIIGDAHSFLLKNYMNFNFIWSSPPCPTHSHIRKELAVEARQQNKPIFPDMKLYEEILFLEHFFKGKWVVENVISYYNPLIKPFISGHHYFWSNFHITDLKCESFRGHHNGIKDLEKLKGFNLDEYKNIDKRVILRNCINPKLGKHILECAIKFKQEKIYVEVSERERK